MHKVIHWSSTFPANFPDRLANIINRELDSDIHQCYSIVDAQNFEEEMSVKYTHVVHSALNIPLFTKAFPSTPFILFIHGQHDSSKVQYVERLRKNEFLVNTFVTTPDLLRLFPNTTFFPFAPIDTIKETEKMQTFLRPSNVRIFSEWKGTLFDVAVASPSYGAFVILGFIYMLLRKALFRFGKLYPLRVFRSNKVSRTFLKSRKAYLHALSTSEFIVDTDLCDFPNGGNISMTGLDALALGRSIVSGIDSPNLEVLAKFYGSFPRHLVHEGTMQNIWKLSRDGFGCKGIDHFMFDEASIFKNWKSACPAFFEA